VTRLTGTVTNELDPRGFGFIECEDGVKRFFQAKQLRGIAFDRLQPGTRVSLTPGFRPGKGPRAFGVELIADQPQAVA
jgi:cold shock CspA family protein